MPQHVKALPMKGYKREIHRILFKISINENDRFIYSVSSIVCLYVLSLVLFFWLSFVFLTHP